MKYTVYLAFHTICLEKIVGIIGLEKVPRLGILLNNSNNSDHDLPLP